MKQNLLARLEQNGGDLIAGFGEANRFKYLNGKFELRGGGAGGAADYVELQSRFLAGWRRAFGQDDVPFYFAQLPNWGNPGDATRTRWAFFREGQARLQPQPNAGMAVAIDIGETDDIHPRYNQEVGRRLALLALAKT